VSKPVPICRPVKLPDHLATYAAALSVRHYAANQPTADPADFARMGGRPSPQYLAGAAGTLWKPGTTLTVGFLEKVSAALRDLTLTHARAWCKTANVKFVYSTQSPVIRVTFAGEGLWSYLGNGAKVIPQGEPTLCLQGYTVRTPHREWCRGARHEFGHALGFVHEHARREIVDRLHVARTIAHFRRTQGWDEAMVRDQILTPLEVRSLWLPGPASTDCIMCYQFEGTCTKDHRPIPGGLDISADDYAVAGRIYPGPGEDDDPPPPEPPPPPTPRVVILPLNGQAEAEVSPAGPALFGFNAYPATTYRLGLEIAATDPWLGPITPVLMIVGASGISTPVPLPDGHSAHFRVAVAGAYQAHVHYPLSARVVARLTKGRLPASHAFYTMEVLP
jgi:hypothetical protein